MITLTQIAKTYGPLTALHPTDLTIETGLTTVLIGPSGCGKSTILRLVVGLMEPTSGTVNVAGRDVNAASVQVIRRKMGYVIQDGGLFPHLTAGQNALLMSKHLKRPEADSRRRLVELCDLTRFPHDGLTRYPVELSGGQRQRVSLMRALMLDPDILLLDEPLGALDPLVRAGLQTDLKEIFRELKKTVLLVTHDMAEAGFLGDQIVLMREGRIVQKGSLADLQQRPSDPFVSEFISAQRSLVQL